MMGKKHPRGWTAFLLVGPGLAACLAADKIDPAATGGGAAGAGGTTPPPVAGAPAPGGSGPAVAGATGGSGPPMAAGHSAEFVAIYNEILNTKCGPCHVTNLPRSGRLDLGDAATAFKSLIGNMTTCGATTETRLVVPGNPDESYLVKKLLGTQPMGMGCGQRMPRTPMRMMPPGCVDAPPARLGFLADLLAPQAADTTGPRDAGVADAGPQAAPRACLPATDVDRIRAWIRTVAP
jgi:hypothetical protein